MRFHVLMQPMYLVSNPETVHEILMTHADQYHKQGIAKQILKKFLGNGILMSDGETWQRNRRLAQPSFHMQRVETYMQMMVGDTVHMLDGWQPGERRDIQAEMMALTLRIISQVLFHTEVEEHARELGAAFTVLNELVLARTRFPLPLPDWLPTEQNKHERAAIATIDALVLGQIRTHRAAGVDQGDLLSTLVLAKDEDGSQLSEYEVRDEVMTLVFAGHETTALALSWAFYALAEHPAIEARLVAELQSVLGGRLPTLGDLHQLVYLEMFMREVLRLYTPVWMFSREAITDVVLEGHHLPKGTGIFISPHVMHRNPRYFNDPETFDPERFAPERMGQLPKSAYIPFSAGPRVCIGSAFAMAEARLLLATIVQRYHLALSPGQKVEAEALMSRHIKGGLNMDLVARAR